MIDRLVLTFNALPSGLVAAVIFLLWVSVFFVIKAVFYRFLRTFAFQASTHGSQQLIRSIDVPLILLILVSGGVVAGRFLPSYESFAAHYSIIVKATAIVALVLFLDRILGSLWQTYSPKDGAFHSAGDLIKGSVHVLVYGVGLLVLLDNFGVSITPLVASLGIGSLAAALALRPLMENLIAGVQILTEKPFKVGDFIRLESGEEGNVHRIGWRSTWLKLRADYIVIIPNHTLINSRVTNLHYPNKEAGLLVEAGVHYGSNLERVEEIALDVARQALVHVDGGVKAFVPFVRFHTLNAFEINFTVFLRVAEYSLSRTFKSEFIKRLMQRFAQEGIAISYPIAAVNEGQETAFVNS